MTKDQLQFLALLATTDRVRQAILDAFGVGPQVGEEDK